MSLAAEVSPREGVSFGRGVSGLTPFTGGGGVGLPYFQCIEENYWPNGQRSGKKTFKEITFKMGMVWTLRKNDQPLPPFSLFCAFFLPTKASNL